MKSCEGMKISNNNDELKIILDIESRNHLKKECGGDVTKLRLGLACVKTLEKEEFIFFTEDEIDELENILLKAKEIIGFNLIGHNGLDYIILENHGIPTDFFSIKTFDIMTALIRAFGTYEGLSLDNIVEHTFGLKKKKTKKANYRLIQNNQIEKVKGNLKHELELIERLYFIIINGGTIHFRTPMGLIDAHELPPFSGFFPEYGEDIVEPYDFPFAGMRLQIKDRREEIIQCKKCNLSWIVRYISYFGDTMAEKVYCPKCGTVLTEVRTSLFGPSVEIVEVKKKK